MSKVLTQAVVYVVYRSSPKFQFVSLYDQFIWATFEISGLNSLKITFTRSKISLSPKFGMFRSTVSYGPVLRQVH